MKRAAHAFVTILLILFIGACGVRTMPRAPEETAARAPDAIEATLTAKGATITWSRPTRTVDGSRLYDLAKFVVERQTGEGSFEPIATIDVTDLDRIRPQRSFRYVDAAVPSGSVRYRVRAVTADGESGIPTEPVTAVTASANRSSNGGMEPAK